MRFIFRAIAVVPLFVPLTAFADPVQDEIFRLVREQDHIVIEPSSNVYKPGAFVARRLYDPNEAVVSTTKLSFLCTPEYSTDKIDAQAIRVSIASSLFGTIVLDKDTVSRKLQMPRTADFAESVSVRILDQAMVQYSDQHLKEIKDNLGPVCKSSLQAGIAAQNAYQITSVYEARVQYEVRFRPTQTEQAKSDIRKELRRLGTSILEWDSEVVRGEVSVYGIAWRKIGS
ncbi:hypothetical protein V1291_004966 [Nitrobacteraceae bacterium AZCC 1564]